MCRVARAATSKAPGTGRAARREPRKAARRRARAQWSCR
ncbi:conserved hypothetical protein [Burkholderia mallei PRL-20]|nr:conserved hypothetical protein [Burkholderia pseudomallei Pakistan 9]EES45524.1 conserved hypothetical protein [Burkholderia mallei PRL-20]